jgi:hypothetical protein
MCTGVKRLITKEQHLVLRERLMQFLDLTVAERLCQFHAFDRGANPRRNGCDANRVVAHGMTFQV